MFRVVLTGRTAAARRYFDEGLAHEDYYTPKVQKESEREEPSRWGGIGAQHLGLTGAVTREVFHRLWDNLLPDGSGPLTARTKANRRVGYDLNFHPPKSVSLLWEFTGDRAILESFRAAVSETMTQLESDAKTRVRKGGESGDRLTGNLLWAEFIHTTARPVRGVPDPHLHAHCFTFNATFDPVEGRWKAGEFGDIKRRASFYEAAFHARLAKRLAECGYGVEPRGRFWEVEGIPESAIRKFSHRTAQIERVASDRGIKNAKQKSELGARTRRSKNESRPWAEVRTDWALRLTAEETAALRSAKSGRVAAQNGREAARDAVRRAIESHFDNSPTVPERSVCETALRLGVGRVTLDAVRAELADSTLTRKALNGDVLLSSPAASKHQTRVTAFARDGRGALPLLCRSAKPEASNELTERQRQSMSKVLGSRDRVMVVRGNAAQTIAEPTLRAIQEAGIPVTKVAGREGTISFLADRERQGRVRGGVIWASEAGGIGLRGMAELFDAAKELKARVVLADSTRRSRSAESLGLLSLLEREAGVRSGDAAERRRERTEERTAARSLGAGHVPDSFAKLERLGAVREAKVSEIPKQVAEEYVKAAKQKKTTQVVTAFENIASVCDAIRERLRESKLLGRSRKFEKLTSLNLTERDKREASSYKPGHVVMFYKSVKGFKAGHRYEVMGHDPLGNVLARHLAPRTSLLPNKLPWIEALPLSKGGTFNVFHRSEIELARGDSIWITGTGRTLNETFGPEKLLSKRGKAIRLANMKMLGLKAPDRRYRVQKDSLHRISGFTLLGNIKLENGWVLPKNYGHLEYGYCVGSQTRRGQSVECLILTTPSAGFLKGLDPGRTVETVRIVTDNLEGLRSSVKELSIEAATERRERTEPHRGRTRERERER